MFFGISINYVQSAQLIDNLFNIFKVQNFSHKPLTIALKIPQLAPEQVVHHYSAHLSTMLLGFYYHLIFLLSERHVEENGTFIYFSSVFNYDG
jgi:hypothetical protein